MSYDDVSGDGWAGAAGKGHASRKRMPSNGAEGQGLPDWMYLDAHGKKQHKDRCGLEHPEVGCGKFFKMNEYNFPAKLCNTCAAKFAGAHGVPYDFVSYLSAIRSNLRWYVDKVPQLDGLAQATQIRMIALAIGVKVKDTSQDERDGAEWLRESVKALRFGLGLMDRSMKNPDALMAEAKLGMRTV